MEKQPNVEQEAREDVPEMVPPSPDTQIVELDISTPTRDEIITHNGVVSGELVPDTKELPEISRTQIESGEDINPPKDWDKKRKESGF